MHPKGKHAGFILACSSHSIIPEFFSVTYAYAYDICKLNKNWKLLKKMYQDEKFAILQISLFVY